MKPKKVELTELFYDLVYVFAISKMTALIHHPHHGVIDLFSIFTFVSCLVVVVNTWVVEVIFINRYGKNSMVNNISLLLSMMPLLLISNTFTTEAWENVFFPYTVATASLSFIQFVQYAIQYVVSIESWDKKICRNSMFSLGLRTLILLISTIVPFKVGIVLFFIGIFSSAVLPIFFINDMKGHPINFPHLVERMTLLVIIMFGEMIIGIAPYFTVKTVQLSSLLIFLIVVNLFLFYVLKFDHLIDHKRTNETGVRMIYLHYLIFISLSIITVSLSFFMTPSVNPLFRNIFLGIGLCLFYGGVLAHMPYNKSSKAYTKRFYQDSLGILIIGILLFIIAYKFTMLSVGIVLLLTYGLFALLLKFHKKSC